VLNYCFTYDAEGKKYVFNITKVSGTIIILIAAALLIGLILSNRKRKKIKETSKV
jgi:protein SCO1/2